ncbi:Golgi SNAP receptor complex member 1-like [Daphnia pulicaria]|uniref:Golgi SNAP receptor complex member 1-like n=1 Tax=Daphnia pulicaria TaxID=35523 RepID=UPI001EEA5586|nr:Golgi SNAP receptor complex member 1-like [Daphnia pulicaria]
MTRGTYSWEDLRKQARQLENEIDAKLVSFSKLGLGSTPFNNSKSNGESAHLLGENFAFESVSSEIQQLLSKLTDVNSQMTEVSASQAPSAALQHTLQRHRDILQDYTTEFQKTSSHLQSKKEREDLLGSVRRDIDAYKNDSGRNRRTDLYLKENEHLRSSERMVDDQINIAIETKEHIANQRTNLKRMQARVNDLASRFPVINSVVQRINFRKRRDAIILGSVIGFGCILLLLYSQR